MKMSQLIWKMSQLIWMMVFAVVLGFSVTGVVVAQNPPPGTTTVVRDVTATDPLVSSGGSTPNISLTPGAVVTAVTATAPLVSSGGDTPVISLPGVTIAGADGRSAPSISLGTLIKIGSTPPYLAIGENASRAPYSTAIGDAAGGGVYSTAIGSYALGNSGGEFNTAIGWLALSRNSGSGNTAIGANALVHNHDGSGNTAVGYAADVGLLSPSAFFPNNATAIGNGAIVYTDNTIQLGNTQVAAVRTTGDILTPTGTVYARSFVSTSDATKKENFQPVDGQAVLNKIQGLNLRSWNFIGQDPKQFRHYGPVAQEFFAAFGSDGLGTIGTPTTITSGDIDGILMIAVQALEKRTGEEVENLKAENATLKARLEAMEKTLTK